MERMQVPANHFKDSLQLRHKLRIQFVKREKDNSLYQFILSRVIIFGTHEF